MRSVERLYPPLRREGQALVLEEGPYRFVAVRRDHDR
jgi:hypothetical protein